MIERAPPAATPPERLSENAVAEEPCLEESEEAQVAEALRLSSLEAHLYAVLTLSSTSFLLHRPGGMPDMSGMGGGMGGAPPEEPADEGPKIEEID